MKTATALVLAGVLGFGGVSGASGPDFAAAPDPTALRLEGTVTAAETGEPLAAVQVTVPALGLGALTDARGRFLILVPDHAVGTEVTVRAVLVGFETASAAVRLSDGENRADLRLETAAVALEEVVVTGVVGAAPRLKAGDASIGHLPGLPQAQTAPGVPLRGARSAADVASSGVAGGHGAHHPGRRPRWNTEDYARIVENPFLAVGPNPLSTFSIDVDRASYANVRRHLQDGVLPPVDAVRIEELINYFGYDDPVPGPGDHTPFRVSTEVAPAPWQPLHRLVRIALRSRPVATEDLPPANLVFLVDVSGSMHSPDKLPLLKQALGMLVDQLRPEDRVAIVVYAGAAGLVLESTPGSEKARIQGALERLHAGGSTAGGAGIRLAYEVARRHHVEGGNNRVILATDGDFNVGPSSDAEMVRLVEEKREQGTFLTVLGFGTGNLKDAKMEQLADHGNGNFAYIDGPLEARKVLVGELGGTLLTVAKDVKLQVEFNPARVAGYRLIGYENRLLAAEDFDDDRKDAGELGAGHSVVALYEVVPRGVEGTVELREPGELRYRDTPGEGDAVGPAAGAAGAPTGPASDELLYVKLRWKAPDGDRSTLMDHPVRDAAVPLARTSDDFRFSAAVAAWGMLLRDSEHCGDFGFDEVARLARSGLGPDAQGYRAEMIGLVGASARLAADRHGEADRGGEPR